MEKYSKYSDEEIVAAYHDGDEDAITFLLEKYKPLVRAQAKSFFLIGGETQDLIQEGMIGLMKAVMSYDDTKNDSFFPFAKMCVNRQEMKAVERSNRKKNQPLNGYISYYEDMNENREPMIDRLISNKENNPEQMMLDEEFVLETLKKVKGELSSLELQVLESYLSGYDYHDIARNLGKTDKAIDNAIQRIRQKARKVL